MIKDWYGISNATTLSLHSLQQPSAVDGYLHELVSVLGILPTDAYEVDDLGEAPAALRRVVETARAAGQSCACWRDEHRHHYLFLGEIAPELTKERGMPVLQVDVYGDEGLSSAGTWVLNHQGKRQLCGVD